MSFSGLDSILLHLKTIARPAALSIAGAAVALGGNCSVRDTGYLLMSDCSANTWYARVEWNIDGMTGWVEAGYLTGVNACDSGGLSCNGSYRGFYEYKSTKSFQSYPTWWDPEIAEFCWLLDDKYLYYESCEVNGQSANNANVYSFTHMSSTFTIWCN